MSMAMYVRESRGCEIHCFRRPVSIHFVYTWTDRHSGYFSYTFCSVSKPQTFRVTMYRGTYLPLTFRVLYPHLAVFVCLGYVIVRLMIAVSETRTSSSEYGRDRKDT